MRSLFLALFLLAHSAFGAGTVTVTKTTAPLFTGSACKVLTVQVDWVGDASTGSVPDTLIQMGGYLMKVVTNPGSGPPTSNYDMTLGDAEDAALDVLAGAIQNRHTTTTEQVYPAIAGTIGTVSSFPVFLPPGRYTFTLSNNTQASAQGRVLFYLTDCAR